MDYVKLNKKMQELMNLPPCEWGVISQDLTEDDFHIIRIWTGHRIELLKRLVIYADLRGGGGCGDSGHDLALEATR